MHGAQQRNHKKWNIFTRIIIYRLHVKLDASAQKWVTHLRKCSFDVKRTIQIIARPESYTSI